MNKIVVKALFGIATGVAKFMNLYSANPEKINFMVLDIFSVILCFV